MKRGFFVTATDTGVGKTVVTGGLAAALVRKGVDVGVMKPFATGARQVGRRLVSDDALFLQRVSGSEDPLDLINPSCLRTPLAPAMAAKVEKKPIDVEAVWSAWLTLRRLHSTMIVEGVGGLLVPLFPRWTVARFAQRLKLPLLIVTRPTLGTINHTALTVHAARTHGLRIAGLIINHAVKVRPGLAERLNPSALEAETRVPVLGIIPYLGADPLRAVRHAAFDRLASAL